MTYMGCALNGMVDLQCNRSALFDNFQRVRHDVVGPTTLHGEILIALGFQLAPIQRPAKVSCAISCYVIKN